MSPICGWAWCEDHQSGVPGGEQEAVTALGMLSVRNDRLHCPAQSSEQLRKVGIRACFTDGETEVMRLGQVSHSSWHARGLTAASLRSSWTWGRPPSGLWQNHLHRWDSEPHLPFLVTPCGPVLSYPHPSSLLVQRRLLWALGGECTCRVLPVFSCILTYTSTYLSSHVTGGARGHKETKVCTVETPGWRTRRSTPLSTLQ